MMGENEKKMLLPDSTFLSLSRKAIPPKGNEDEDEDEDEKMKKTMLLFSAAWLRTFSIYPSLLSSSSSFFTLFRFVSFHYRARACLWLWLWLLLLLLLTFRFHFTHAFSPCFTHLLCLPPSISLCTKLSILSLSMSTKLPIDISLSPSFSVALPRSLLSLCPRHLPFLLPK